MNWVSRFLKRRSSTPTVFHFDTRPASSHLFGPSPQRIALDEQQRKSHCILQVGIPPGHLRVSRQDTLECPLNEASEIRAHVAHARAHFIGRRRGRSLMECRSETHSQNARDAQRKLDRIFMEYSRGCLRLSAPPKDRSCADFLVICHVSKPIKVRADYASICVEDVEALVDVETTHARITLNNLLSTVNARVQEGIIDYAGQQGTVRLFAGWEVNLKLTSSCFAGQLEAVSKGAVRILLPPDFQTPFIANLAPNAEFVCRSEIASKLRQTNANGRKLVTFGESGYPVIRLTAIEGPIVMDDYSEDPDSTPVPVFNKPFVPILQT